MPDYNGGMFRLARQYRNYTQRELADRAKVAAPTLSRIENGVIAPPEDVAQRLIKELKFPAEFFKQAQNISGLPLSVHPMWRRKASVSQRDIDRALASMNIRLLHLRRLLPSVEYQPILALPEWDIETYGSDPAKLAETLRRTWQMPAGPVKDLTGWIERAGVFVIHMEMPDASMDGVTLRSPDLPPCIFLNKHLPADRMRHTLAHELGHLIMHRFPNPHMESEANKFAGTFLMPAADIRPYFSGRRVDLRLLAALKPEWRVAMQSLLYRATDLGFVDKNQARYLWMQFNQRKLRMREPAELDFPVEQPTLAPHIIQLHLEELGYTVAELEAMVNMYEEELTEFHGLKVTNKPQLRVV